MSPAHFDAGASSGIGRQGVKLAPKWGDFPCSPNIRNDFRENGSIYGNFDEIFVFFRQF